MVKEGTSYRVKIEFRVQREIVAGLRYFQVSYRKGIRGMWYAVPHSSQEELNSITL